MTVDLWMLLAAAGLQWLLIMTPTTLALLTNGLLWGVSNREVETTMPAWGERAKRASANLQENLTLFAIVVLVTHVSGAASDTTALGAEVFVAARVAHALLYIAGVPWLRTMAWAVSIAGLGIMLSAIL